MLKKGIESSVLTLR